MDLVSVLVSLGISSAFFSALLGFISKRLEKRLDAHEAALKAEEDKRKAEQEKIEAARKQHEILLVQSVSASMALGEATARAVQRIPGAHCNGDMHKALEYATQVKHAQKDFLTKQGIDALF